MRQPSPLLPLFLLACGDQGLKAFNSSPSAAITSLEEGDEVVAGAELILAGRVDDPDHDPEELVATWYADEVELCSGLPDEEGHSSCAWTPSEGPHRLRLEAVDPGDAVGSDAVEVTTAEAPTANTAPSCQISAPESGSSGPVGELLYLEGSANDAEEAPGSLTIRWESDKDGILGESIASSGGEVLLATDALSADTHTISIVVIDDHGEICTDFVVYTVGGAPTLDLISPLEGAVYNLGEPVPFEAWVSDGEDSPDELLLRWESDLDGLLHEGAPDSTGQSSFSMTGLSAGWQALTVQVEDQSGMTASASLSFAVNTAPSQPTVDLGPEPAYGGDELVAVASGSVDADGIGSLAYRYEWWVDGALSSLSTSDRFPAASVQRGSTYTLRVTPTDGHADGPWAEDSLLVGNGLPSVAAAVVLPSGATASSALSCAWSGYSDPDGDPDLSTVSWEVDGAPAGSGSSPSPSPERDQEVVCIVTPNDGYDAGAPVRSAPLTIANSPPTAPVASIDPSSPTEGEDDLVCEVATPSSDLDGDAITYTVTWSVDGVDYLPGGSTDTADTGPGWSGATTTTWPGDTVPAEDTLAGELWVCTITPTDGTDDGGSGTDAVTIGESGPPSSCPDGNCSLRFDGSDDWVQVAHSSSLTMGGSSFTVEAWIWHSTFSNCQTSVRKGTSGSPIYTFWLHKNYSPSDSLFWGSWTGFTVQAFSAAISGRWWHYAGVYDAGSGQARMYINGALASSGAASRPTDNTDPMLIGIDWDRGCDFNGWIDEVRVSDVARYSGAFTPTTRFTSDADTRALYHFDEYTGSTAWDSSGNGNHGVIYNATWSTSSP